MRRCSLEISIVVVAVVAFVLSFAPPARAEFNVAGRVVDESGKPIPGAIVYALKLAYPWRYKGEETRILAQTETDGTGRFSLPLEKPLMMHQQCAFAVRHRGYGIAWVTNYMLIGRRENLADITLTMPEPGFIRGKVTDPEGSPVSGAVVVPAVTIDLFDLSPTTVDLPPCEQLLSTTTGADGTFVVSELPAKARAALIISHPDFARTPFGSVSYYHLGGTIKVGTTDITVKLERGATIEGKVTFRDTGQPVEGAFIRVVPVPTESEASASGLTGRMLVGTIKAKTDKDGRYIVGGVPEGRYGVEVEYPDWTAEAKQALNVSKGAPVVDRDFVLTKGVLVSGKFVIAKTGTPVKDGYVVISRGAGLVSADRASVRIEAGADGTFQFRQPPGEVVLSGETPSCFFVVPEEHRQGFTLIAGHDVTDIVFKVEPWATLKGKVLGPQGQPMAGAQVYARTGFVETVWTDANGAFELPFVERRRGAVVEVAIDTCHPDLPGYRGFLTRPFEIGSDTECVIEMKPAARLTGRVVDNGGKPVRWASVIVHQSFQADDGRYSSLYRTARCDDAGRYEIKDLAGGGAYLVYAMADGYGQCRSTELSLSEGDVRTVPDLELQIAPMSIEGTVTDEDGTPMANAEVRCDGTTTGFRRTVTDENGRYRFEHVVDEEIYIHALANVPEGTLQGNIKTAAGDRRADVIVTEQAPFRTREERQAARLTDKAAPGLNVASWINCEPVTLESLGGKAVLLAFWDSTHASCGEVVTLLNRLVSAYSGKKVEVISIHSAGADVTALKQVISDRVIKFRVALDKPAPEKPYKGATFKKYGAKTVASVYIIDAERKIRYQDLPLRSVEEALKTMLTEKR